MGESKVFEKSKKLPIHLKLVVGALAGAFGILITI
jgi:hypothetical protein